MPNAVGTDGTSTNLEVRLEAMQSRSATYVRRMAEIYRKSAGQHKSKSADCSRICN